MAVRPDDDGGGASRGRSNVELIVANCVNVGRQLVRSLGMPSLFGGVATRLTVPKTPFKIPAAKLYSLRCRSELLIERRERQRGNSS